MSTALFRKYPDPFRPVSTGARDALVPDHSDDRSSPNTARAKALSSVCSGNLPRFLVDRPHGGEHHELVDQRASAGSSDPEHSAVIGMEESEMACAVADVGATGDLPAEDAPVMVPGPAGSAPPDRRATTLGPHRQLSRPF